MSLELLKEYRHKHDKKFTVTSLRDMHMMRLCDKVCRLFKYDGLAFPQHEMEFRAIMEGFAGVVKDPKIGIMTAWGGRSGPTEYNDIFTKFTYAATRAKGGTAIIGENAVILKNTTLYESMYMWLYRYAELFTHIDISLRMALINSRYQDIIKVMSESKKDTVKEWYEGLYKGDLLAIIDDTPMSEFLNTDGEIRTLDLTRNPSPDYSDFTELENELTRMFYRDLGVRWNKDKKANLVAGEVEQDDMLLEFNISDMLECRQQFCEEYNHVFGGSVSVKLAVKLESEVKQSEDNSRISRYNE